MKGGWKEEVARRMLQGGGWKEEGGGRRVKGGGWWEEGGGVTNLRIRRKTRISKTEPLVPWVLDQPEGGMCQRIWFWIVPFGSCSGWFGLVRVGSG